MKKILICCGSGIATSTAAANRLKEKLEARGFAGQFTTSQCQVGEVAGKIDDFDLVISTAVITQPLFPYTTLFRSLPHRHQPGQDHRRDRPEAGLVTLSPRRGRFCDMLRRVSWKLS